MTTLGDESMTYDQEGRNLTTTTGSRRWLTAGMRSDDIIGMTTTVTGTGGSTTAVAYTGWGGISSLEWVWGVPGGGPVAAGWGHGVDPGHGVEPGGGVVVPGFAWG